MNTITEFYLIDRGAFNVTPEVEYTDLSGKKGEVKDFKKLMAGQSLTFDPGKSGIIKDGFTVSLKCNVQAGKDKSAGESFTYQSGGATVANYAISGTTLNDDLKFLGTTPQ